MSATKKEFSRLVLDGSAVHAARAESYTRYATILERAIEQKRLGRGLFARPEADVVLLGLLAVMDALAPSSGWLESGMVTFAHAVRDALARAPDVYWGMEWPGPLDGTRFVPFEHYNSAALLSAPRKTGRLKQDLVDSRIGIRASKPHSKPDRGQKQRRRRLHDLLQTEGAILQRYLARPVRKFAKVLPDSSIVIDDEFGEPLWANKVIPPFSGSGAKEFCQFGEAFTARLRDYQLNAWFAPERLPVMLGLESLPDGYEQFSFPRTKWWNDHATWDFRPAELLEFAVLDRLLGASADETLAACLAASRLAACVTRWTLPHAPGWLHVVDWEIALVSCMVGDDYSANVWLTHLPLQSRQEPAANLACEAVLGKWIAERRWPSKLPIPRLMNAFQKGFLKAMQGICEGSAKLASQGIVELMKAYRRVDYRPAEGRPRIPGMCLQAVALERIARKSGLSIDVSPLKPNDPEVLEAKDPTRAVDRWCIHPGTELVTNSPEKFAWPALHLNQPVEAVVDPPVGGDS